jgi:hypothetical protein
MPRFKRGIQYKAVPNPISGAYWIVRMRGR